RHPVAEDLGVDPRTAGPRDFLGLEDEDTGPLARTKPSRSRSKGRLARGGSSLRVDRARIAAKPPRPMWVIAASLPPVIITSAMPTWIARNASPMALAAEAHAVATAEFGPRRPHRIETWPLAALTISLGIV